MSSVKKFGILASVFALWLSTASCNRAADPYSTAYPVCHVPPSDVGTLPLTKMDGIATDLTPECKAVLESLIPYDAESWALAPPGLKDRVNEAFQALIAYPLVIPSENRLLGVAPTPAGALPLDTIRIFQEFDNPNQSIFNYILNQMDIVSYSEDGSDKEAELNPGLKITWHGVLPDFSAAFKWRHVKIHPNFWTLDAPLDAFRNPFPRAAVLAHEARHGDGMLHEPCQGDTKGFNCDADLLGPYGFEFGYYRFLLHGSATCQGDHCKPLLPPFSAMMVGFAMCIMAQRSINHPFQELSELIAPVKCGTDVSANWALSHEKLPSVYDSTFDPKPLSGL